MVTQKRIFSSGIDNLDKLLGGGVFIGDNVIWYDDVGSLANIFCLNFIRTSQAEGKSLIYLSFDRSIKTILQQLGPLTESRSLTILDCFTNGKGQGADVFMKSYEEGISDRDCQIIRIDEPGNIDHVMGVFYGLHNTMKGDVRFIFDSLTGMEELWGGEEQILKFYSHSCPRLYELNTIAYWIIEKGAHSQRLKAHINKIAQVAIELTLKRGRTYLTVLKAERRDMEILSDPHSYWSRDLNVTFSSEKSPMSRIEIGLRLKDLRTKRGISQRQLAKLVGVTPSTISQIENNQIYPSLTALIKMAEILSVDAGSFLKEFAYNNIRTIFRYSEATDIQFHNLPKGIIRGKLLTPVDMELRAEPYVIEIMPEKSLPSHFFIHKGQEIGYLLSGELIVVFENESHKVKAGDTLCFTTNVPTLWKNPGSAIARLVWIKIN